MHMLQRSAWAVGVIVLGLSATWAADDKSEEEAKKEMGRLAGVWAPVSVETGGKKADDTDNVVKELRYVFTKDGKFRLEKAGEVQLEGTYKVDPSKKPRQVDYKIEKSTSDTWKDKTSLGIYELDGDTLRVCRTWPDNDTRPTEFSGAKDTKQIFSEFKREKK